MKLCEKGHFFDDAKHSECPHCPLSEDSGESVPPPPSIQLDSDFAKRNAGIVEILSRHHLIYSIAGLILGLALGG